MVSGAYDVLMISPDSYGKVSAYGDVAEAFLVIIDSSSIDSCLAKKISNFVLENLGCPFIFVDSVEKLAASLHDFYQEPVEQYEECLQVESPAKCLHAEPQRSYTYYLEKMAEHNDIVLLLGESGVGKSYSAEMIHKNSSVRDKKFLHRNLAELNPTLIESELFGCDKGSYTGADVERKGLFEEVEGGTLFLDEIGELSLESQAKLLGVLDTGKFFHVGGSSKEYKIKCRLIFATDADLKQRVKEHTFKKQLYWRLSKYVVKIPPLRERRDEIIPLANFFAEECRKTLSADALAYLKSLEWEGNIRELKFCIERSAALCRDKVLLKKDIILS